MNQLAIDFSAAPRCSVPASETQLGTLLRALQRGERLTVAVALSEYGVYALSQRCGDLIAMGWPVCKDWLTTEKGARVRVYFMEAH